MAQESTGRKIYNTFSILERTDPTEWVALSADNKELFQLLISAGRLYFSDGGQCRNILLGMFPEGTITGDKLRLM